MRQALAALLLAVTLGASAQTVTMEALRRTYLAITSEIATLDQERRLVLSEGRKRAISDRHEALLPGSIQMQPVLPQFRDDFGVEEAAHISERIEKLQADRRLIMEAMRAAASAN